MLKPRETRAKKRCRLTLDPNAFTDSSSHDALPCFWTHRKTSDMKAPGRVLGGVHGRRGGGGELGIGRASIGARRTHHRLSQVPASSPCHKRLVLLHAYDMNTPTDCKPDS
eukprot:6475485-Amphidinium_carterae.1